MAKTTKDYNVIDVMMAFFLAHICEGILTRGIGMLIFRMNVICVQFYYYFLLSCHSCDTFHFFSSLIVTFF